ncbi:MAG: cation:proton antiporter, partial [Gaiella sp.]
MTDGALLAATGGEVSVVFLELGAVVLGLAVVARLSTRAGFSPIPGYLFVGLVVGALSPSELTGGFIDVGAQIGVVLLLFMLGLEYTGDELVHGLRSGAPAGAVDLVANGLPGFAAGLLLGWSVEAALLLAGVTYMTSSGIVA